MPWHRMEMPSNRELSEFMSAFAKKARFLVDETLGESFVGALHDLGYNAIGVAQLGLTGHSDEDVFAAAWRERRILLTQDHDFLDDRRFPPHSNPGVVVLPDEPVEDSPRPTTRRRFVWVRRCSVGGASSKRTRAYWTWDGEASKKALLVIPTGTPGGHEKSHSARR